jgi:hypothetical protein
MKILLPAIEKKKNMAKSRNSWIMKAHRSIPTNDMA